MLSTPDGPFINLARLNFSKYAARPNLAKVLESIQSVSHLFFLLLLYDASKETKDASYMTNHHCSLQGCLLCTPEALGLTPTLP